MNRINFTLLFPVLLMVGMSLLTLQTIEPELLRQQISALILSIGIYFIFLNIDYRIFGLLSKYIYIVFIVLLIVVLFVGVEARGSVRWLDLFGLRIQVSEVFKPFFLIAVASFLAGRESRGLGTFIKTILLIVPAFILTLIQPDLGNAVIFAVGAAFIMLIYGFPLMYFLAAGILAIIPAPIFYSLLHDYQKARLTSFLDMSADPFGSSYNSIQALISIGSGGFLGKGFESSTQSLLRFLPEHHTDFIFAAMTESLGFVGGVMLIGLYMFFLLRIYRIFVSADDTFAHLVSAGFFFLFLTHILFNIGMNVGILPIVGITLPFVSYGGSSLITNFIILGLLSSIGFEHKKHYSYEIG